MFLVCPEVLGTSFTSAQFMWLEPDLGAGYGDRNGPASRCPASSGILLLEPPGQWAGGSWASSLTGAGRVVTPWEDRVVPKMDGSLRIKARAASNQVRGSPRLLGKASTINQNHTVKLIKTDSKSPQIILISARCNAQQPPPCGEAVTPLGSLTAQQLVR